MIKHYRNVWDVTGWTAMFLEWGALWLIAADKEVRSVLTPGPHHPLCSAVADPHTYGHLWPPLWLAFWKGKHVREEERLQGTEICNR